MQCVSVILLGVMVGVAVEASGGFNDYHRSGGAAYGGYGGYRPYNGNHGGYRGGRYYYGGKYADKCAADGLYYRDQDSFVICSNGNSYVQPCAPGTRNSGHHNYAPGYYYGYSDFCDVNLVDYGYAAAAYNPGYNYGTKKSDYAYGAKKDYAYGGKKDYAYGGKKDYGYEEKTYKTESYDAPAKGGGYEAKPAYGYDAPTYQKKEVVQVKETYAAKPTYDSYDKPVVPKASYGDNSYGKKTEYTVESSHGYGGNKVY